MVIYNCPHCGVELKGVDVDKPMRVRCPNIATPEFAKKYYKKDNWPYSGKCGRMFVRLPLANKK